MFSITIVLPSYNAGSLSHHNFFFLFSKGQFWPTRKSARVFVIDPRLGNLVRENQTQSIHFYRLLFFLKKKYMYIYIHTRSLVCEIRLNLSANRNKCDKCSAEN